MKEAPASLKQQGITHAVEEIDESARLAIPADSFVRRFRGRLLAWALNRKQNGEAQCKDAT